MHLTENRTASQCGAGPPRLPSCRRLVRTFLCLITLPTLAAVTLGSQAIPAPPRPSRSILLPEANRPPDANAQMEMRERKTRQQNFEAANAERHRQIVQDSARLLKLAASLKAEMDASAKGTVSPAAMVRAGEIERLARIVKEKMKLTVGAG